MSIEARILAYCEAHRDELVERVVASVNAAPGSAPPDPTETRQGANGVVAILIEGLSGSGGTMREFWLETLFPGLVGRGQSLELITYIGASINVALAVQIVGAMPAEARDEATAWMAHWLAALQADATRVCVAAGAR